ncbi:serine hydrolase domain-containing protein [Singulisphaera sp. PoT]|uniref:serine hydrolase domain-containing protein n=1 Tax=Singulisphaera sp. PoT TaxID=3411797 RepID=UPI003BF526A2
MPLRRQRAWICFLLTSLFVGATARVEADERLTSRADQERAFDDEVRALARLLELPGMVVAVAQDGKIIHRVEHGYADVETEIQATVDHIFWLASVTKTFTATMIMQMVDGGLISLDDRMIDYWYPSFFPMRINSEYRLRHVLGHTARPSGSRRRPRGIRGAPTPGHAQGL